MNSHIVFERVDTIAFLDVLIKKITTPTTLTIPHTISLQTDTTIFITKEIVLSETFYCFFNIFVTKEYAQTIKLHQIQQGTRSSFLDEGLPYDYYK